jgi:hypothetical protein
VALVPARDFLTAARGDPEPWRGSFGGQAWIEFCRWYLCYLEALATRADQFFCCVVWHGAKPEAVIPLEWKSRRILGIRTQALHLPNHPRMVFGRPYLVGSEDPAGYVPQVLAELARQDRRWDYLYMPNLLGDSVATAMAGQEGFIRARDAASGCCCLPVVPYESLPKRLPDGLARSLRNGRKRVAQAANLRFTTAADPPELAQAYRRFLDLEASGWKGENGTRTALRCDRRLRGFYERLVDGFGPLQRCEIHLMWLDEQPIAGQFTLLGDRTIYVLKIAFDETHGDLSPGNVLLDRLFQRPSDGAPIDCISLVTDFPWMHRWRPVRHEAFDLGLYRPSFRGCLAWAYWRMRVESRRWAMAWLRPAYRKLRGSPRQRHAARRRDEG